MTSEHPGVTRFRAAHAERGGTGEVVILPDAAHTAVLAAAALGCEVGAIANSLLFEADGHPVLVLTSGAHRVDTSAVAARIGSGPLRRASAEELQQVPGVGPAVARAVVERLQGAEPGLAVNLSTGEVLDQ